MEKKNKFKHNKKRNTAFLFECLCRELTKATIEKNPERRNAVTGVIRKHFKAGTLLNRELEVYKVVNEAKDTDRATAERILAEAKRVYSVIPQQGLFKAQTELIDDVNKDLGESTYGNFVPNYKSLATLYQIFNTNVKMKERVLLENKVVAGMMQDVPKEENLEPMTNLIFKTFVSKFNEKYGKTLRESQRQLLSRYIASFADDGLEFNMFLNEEVGRLKDKVLSSKTSEHVQADQNMMESVDKVMLFLESFRDNKLEERHIEKIIKIQEFVEEVENDGD
jgi:hypothetical protein